MTAETSVPPATGQAPYPRRWIAMAVLILAFMLDLVNVTIVNVGLPAIQRDLGATPAQLEWISAAYLLAFAAALITFARLGDLAGRKRVFLAGIAVFAVTGVWSGLAGSVEVLIVARAAQGLAAAALAPQVLSILYTLFQGRERAAVFGVFGIMGGLAQAVGLLLGGVVVTADIAGLGWRAIFLVTVPMAVVLLAAGAWLVPESRLVGGLRPKWLATAVLTVGLVAIVFPLLDGRTYGWPVWIWFCLVAGIVALAGLALVEHRKNPAGALLPLDLFRVPVVSRGLTVLLLIFASFSGFLLILTLWLQGSQEYSPLDAGLLMAAFAAGGVAMSPFTGRLLVRFGRTLILLGSSLAGVGALVVLLAARAADGPVGAWTLVPGLFVMGLSMNLVVPTLATLFLAGVPVELAGAGSGIFNTGQQFGGALGVAGIGAIYFAALDSGGPRAAVTAGTVAVAVGLVVSGVVALTIPRISLSES
ncbi:MFS transporter [Kribbella italica]|uniref:MFS family permease n=1 Tax=Kribbella italica TaxID=1540520 RepID=A0A7W9J8F5_9ACTN|nr:MFS family permease [Kribbella italica]